HLDEHAGGGRRDFGIRLVRRDFDERLIALDPLAGLHQPLHHRAFDDRFAELRHRDGRRGHGTLRLAPGKQCVNERYDCGAHDKTTRPLAYGCVRARPCRATSTMISAAPTSSPTW